MLLHAVIAILACVVKADNDITDVNDSPVYLIEILLGRWITKKEPKEVNGDI